MTFPLSAPCRALAILGLSLMASGCGSGGSAPPLETGGEPVEELVELLLRAVALDDQPLPVDGRGVPTVAVGGTFLLELSYLDHRPEGERLGASEIFVDLLTDRANVLRPVVAETLRLIVGEEIRTANPAGTVTFGIEGRMDSYQTAGAAFVADPEGALTAALTHFGYGSGQDYILTRLDLGSQDIGLQVHWDVGRHGNVDMPDLFLTLGFPEAVPSQTIEFAPFEPDGVTVNPSALRLTLDTRSRGFNGNARFYDDMVSVGYDPATGFSRVGGKGPDAVGGIPALSNDGTLPQPFDAFRLPVMVVAPVTGLTIHASPTQTGPALFLYGLVDEVSDADIRTDGDHLLTIDAVER